MCLRGFDMKLVETLKTITRTCRKFLYGLCAVAVPISEFVRVGIAIGIYTQLIELFPKHIVTSFGRRHYDVLLIQRPHTLEDDMNRTLGGTLPVGIFDMQYEALFIRVSMEPGEQRFAHTTDVKRSCGTGSEMCFQQVMEG